jgi:hypothetical protein
MIKRLVFGILTLLATLATAGFGVEAASAPGTTEKAGPYEGIFKGSAYGDVGSRAPLNLDLTHRGREVKGEVSLGEGLYVDGGLCGKVHVPATKEVVEGQTVLTNPKRLVVTPTFNVGGFDLAVNFESDISADGEVIVARAKVDLPWFCGRDPVLAGVLYRD